MDLKWTEILSDDDLPDLKDDSVLAYWPATGAIEMVHIEDWFGEITSGLDDEGNQKYTRWHNSLGAITESACVIFLLTAIFNQTRGEIM